MKQLAFRTLARDDFPLVVAWHRAPHAARWFEDNSPLTLVEAEGYFGPCIDGSDPTHVHVLEIDGVPSGYLQHYLVRDEPVYLAAIGHPDAAAIDFIIGDPALVGQGLGARVIRRYIDDVVKLAHPAVPRVISSPDPQNERSIRALEKAGFRRGPVAQVLGRPELVCILDLVRG